MESKPFHKELAAFVALAVLTTLLMTSKSVEPHVLNFLSDRRKDLYSALLSLEVTLLGFIVAVLTIALSFAASPRLAIVRASRFWPSVFRSYTRAMRWSACAAIVALTSLCFDRDKDPHLWLTSCMAISLLFSTLAVARMLWTTERVVEILTARAPNQQ